MKRAIREYRAPALTIVLFAILATAAGIYTLSQQRIRLPFEDRYDVRVAFAHTPGLAPGLGQPANVAGVPVGQITDADVVKGRSVVTLSIEADELPAVYRDASAVLRPNTPLQDMQIDLVPGTRAAGRMPADGVIPIERTTIPISASGILTALDGDTRDYFTALLTSLGEGLDGRGLDLREIYKQIGPTAKQAAELSAALARRRDTLAQVVTSLSTLSVAAGRRDREIAQVIDAGAATLRAMASQDAALRESIQELPPTLEQARRSLDATTELAGEVRPTLAALEPSARRAPEALAAADRLVRVAAPATRKVVRPFVRTSIDALAPLPQASRHLNAVAPDLSTTFKVLEYLGNELFYSAGGKTKPYAYWAAWAQHNGNSVVANGDAVSQVLRGAMVGGCSSILTALSVSAPQYGVPELSNFFNQLSALVPSVCPASDGPR